MFEENEKELRLGQLRIIIVIMIILFAVLLSYTIYWSVDYNKKYGYFEKTSAEVVSQEVKYGVLRDIISYEVNGVEYKLTADYVSKNEIGDTITIYYDINNPFGVIYSIDIRKTLLPVLTSLFGTGCVVLCVIYGLTKKDISDRKKWVEYLQKSSAETEQTNTTTNSKKKKTSK